MSSGESELEATPRGFVSEFELTASQAASKYYEVIGEKYGHLPRDKFVTEMSTNFISKDLNYYRQGVYDTCLLEKADTPRGKLILRKDTQNIGGKTVEEKLAEDIYAIYHYIQGDLSMNIIDILSEIAKSHK